MSRDEGARSVKVGVFLAITFVVLAALVMLLGKTQSLFARKAVLHASFENTSGLVVGAPVRLAGVDIGIVQSIHFDKDLKEKNVHVTLGVESAYLERIREDSIAHLSSKGLLGDMIINITVGSADKPALHNGSSLKSQESQGLTEVIDSVQEAIGEVRTLTGNVNERVKVLITDDLAHDVGRIAHGAANVIEKVEKGSGLVHTLVYDPSLAQSTTEVVAEARRFLADTDRAVARVDHIVAAVETGDGTLHALVYGDDGKKMLAEANRAMKEISDLIAEIQHGKGLLHSLVYEEDRSNMIQNLTAMSKILRNIAEEVEEGKGTVGALLKDPSVYEDLKTILGNIKRNKLLKALVRYTIEKDGLSADGKTPKGD